MRLGAGAAIAALVMLTALLGVPPAEASGPTPGSAGPAGNCVLRLDRTGTAGAPVCFDSFQAAIAFATGGVVTDAPASAGSAATDPAFAARLATAGPAASAVLGLEYADINFGGGSLTLSAPAGCDNSSDVDWQFASLPASWNDRISSFRSFSNCIQRLYRDVNFGVALTPATTSMSWVGSAANDRASSIRFY